MTISRRKAYQRNPQAHIFPMCSSCKSNSDVWRPRGSLDFIMTTSLPSPKGPLKPLGGRLDLLIRPPATSHRHNILTTYVDKLTRLSFLRMCSCELVMLEFHGDSIIRTCHEHARTVRKELLACKLRGG